MVGSDVCLFINFIAYRWKAQFRSLDARRLLEAEQAERRLLEAERSLAQLKEKADMVKQAARGQKRRAERAEHRLEEREELIAELQVLQSCIIRMVDTCLNLADFNKF